MRISDVELPNSSVYLSQCVLFSYAYTILSPPRNFQHSSVGINTTFHTRATDADLCKIYWIFSNYFLPIIISLRTSTVHLKAMMRGWKIGLRGIALCLISWSGMASHCNGKDVTDVTVTSWRAIIQDICEFTQFPEYIMWSWNTVVLHYPKRDKAT